MSDSRIKYVEGTEYDDNFLRVIDNSDAVVQELRYQLHITISSVVHCIFLSLVVRGHYSAYKLK